MPVPYRPERRRLLHPPVIPSGASAGTRPCGRALHRVMWSRVFAEDADSVTERDFDSWQAGVLARGS